MSKRNSIINTAIQPPLRRSARLLQHQQNTPEPQNPSTRKSKPASNRVPSSNPPLNSTKSDSLQILKRYPNTRTSNKLCRSDNGLRKSLRLNREIDVSQSLKRSPRFYNRQNDGELAEKSTEDKFKKRNKCGSNKSKGRCEVGVGSFEQINVSRISIVLGLKAVNVNERKEGDVKGNEEIAAKKSTDDKLKKRIKCGLNKSKGRCEVGVGSCEQMNVSRFSIVLGLKAFNVNERKEGDVNGNEEITITRRRKRNEEGKESSKIQGWKREQEMALQRAYLAVKPTPRFWKKVSKLVPGKSAHECFDKIHSDHVTPPEPQPQSRANKMNSSPLNHFSLSASKLLKPIELKIKKSSRSRQKSHIAQKTVRHLLQKNYHVDAGCEADLLSVLEPNINLSTPFCKQDGLHSTPKLLQEKQEFLQRCHERSSGHKKPLSRFSNSCGTPLVTPPVLKQVKNRALHEKYIDQLHCREAKRKAASAQAETLIPGKEDRPEINNQKIDVIKAAKNALITDARNVINQLQHLHANNTSNSSDLDSDDDEGETEL